MIFTKEYTFERKGQIGIYLSLVTDALLVWFRNMRNRLRTRLKKEHAGLVPYRSYRNDVSVKVMRNEKRKKREGM